MHESEEAAVDFARAGPFLETLDDIYCKYKHADLNSLQLCKSLVMPLRHRLKLANDGTLLRDSLVTSNDFDGSTDDKIPVVTP